MECRVFRRTESTTKPHPWAEGAYPARKLLLLPLKARNDFMVRGVLLEQLIDEVENRTGNF